MTPERSEPAAADAGAADSARSASHAPSVGRMFKNATIYGVGQAIVSVLSFVTDPILSYLLTLADFGLLGLTRTITGFLSNFYRLGLDGATNRIYYDVEHDKGAQRRAIGTINTFLLAWTILLCLVQELAGPAIYDRVFDGLPYAPYGRFVAYALLCNALIAVAQSIWGAQERAKLVAGIRLVTALLGTAITFGLLFTTKLGVLAVYAAEVVGATIMLWAHLRFAYRSFGFAWSPGVMRRALAFGLPMVVHLTSHWALQLADRILLEKLMSREAVGLYTAAYATTTTLIMISNSVNGAYVPQFMRAHGKPEQEAFVARAITYFLLVVSAATLGFILFAPTVIRGLYSARFAPAAPLTPILALAAPMQAIYLIYVNALFRADRTRIIPILTLLAAATNVGLNLWWIPKYGVIGAAWATFAGYVMLAMLFRFGARRVVRLPFERGRLARIFVTFAAVTAMAVTIDGRFPIAFELVVKSVVALVAPAILAATGFLRAEEREWLRRKLGAALARVRS